MSELDVCKLSFIGIAEDARGVEQMRKELASKAHLSVEDFARRTLVGVPETIADYLRSLSAIGINHHILAIAQSELWSNYPDASALVQSEVVPRLRD